MIRSKIFPVFFIPGIILLFLSGCVTSKKKYSGFTTVRKYQKNKPFIFKNNITLIAPDLNKDDKATINSKLNTQLDDSAKVKIKDVAFIFHYITRPPVFDTNAIIQSANSMKTAMINQGYYNSTVSYSFDTVIHSKQQKRIIINYNIIARFSSSGFVKR